MVRDRLSRFCTGVWNRVEQHRPLAISVAAAGTLALGLTSWSLMEQGKLSPVGMERGRQRVNNPSSSVPLPPKSRSWRSPLALSLIHISEPTRLLSISYAVFCLKKKK